MNLTEEQLKAIEALAYRLITPQLIAINIEVDELELATDIRTPGTQANRAYYKGYVRQVIEARESIIKAAHNGSNPAQVLLIGYIHDAQFHLRYE